MGKLAKSLIRDLNRRKNLKKAKILQVFFKTGPGEYGEGDIFLGIAVPIQRKIVKKYSKLNLKEIQELLNSKIHEYRFSALIILVEKYKHGNEKDKKQIFDFYIKNSRKINNWDLVDVSAPSIAGDYLSRAFPEYPAACCGDEWVLKKSFQRNIRSCWKMRDISNKNKDVLLKLAKSKNIWQRRIAILSTFRFIRKNNFKETLKISKALLKDKYDLIHKAVGWMLREVGKKNPKIEKIFLKKYSRQMPRVMLRYAIEKFSKAEKKHFLSL